MNIIVYDKNTNKDKFNNYGYGKLRLINKCEVTEELNGRYDVELIVNMDDPKSKYLTKWAILRIDGQLFRINNIINNDKENTIKIYARHIFYDLSYGFIEDKKADGSSMVDAMLKALPDDFATVYTVASDIDTVGTIYFVKNSGTESIFTLIDRWGQGELIRDNFNITINKNKGQDRGVTFTYKKIDAIEITEELDEVVTRLYPTGKDGLTLKEKYIYIPNWSESDYLPFHITKEVKFDDVDNEGTLRELAKQQAETIGVSKVNFKINVHDLLNTDLYKSIPDLLRVQTGDIVTIKHPKLNIRVKVKVIKKVEEKATGRVTIELGQPSANFFDSVDNNKATVITPDLSDYKEKMFYYNNGLAINNIGETFQSIAYVTYGVNARNNLTLLFNMFINCEESGTATIRLVNDNEIMDFQPSVDLEVGRRLISFSYPLISVKENVNHSINFMVSMGTGKASIEKDMIQIMIKGQGVNGGLTGELPHAEVVEKVEFEHINNCDIERIISPINITKIDPIKDHIEESINFNEIEEVTRDLVKDESQVILISTGYTRPMVSSNFIYNTDVITVNNGSMTIKNVTSAVTGVVSETQFEVGTLHEIELMDRSLYNSIEKGEIK